jgi:SpoVK/Ycf46/Vps4 family AAA+-type ATPase
MPSLQTVSKIIRAIIQCPIETLSDLISLAKRAYVHPKDAVLDEELIKALEDPAPKEPLPMYPISPYVKYNIDLELLYRVLPEMENLESMVGQTKLKVQVANMILYNAMGLDKRGEKDLLHTVIYGSPGTGKTEFAQRIAKIYLKMGVLHKNIFKKVKRSDLIAGYLGQTAIKTMEVIEEVRGGVLFIDEAYSLSSSQGKEGRDSFSKECVDTLNQCLTEMRDRPEHYFILIIAGYKDDLERSFFALNDGLERRFTVHLTMDDYKPDDMVEIFKKKVRDAQWAVAENVVTSDFMKNNAEHFKYAGGDMEVLFSKCKVAHSRNLLKGATKTKYELSLCDLNDGFAIYKSICGRTVETNDSDAFWKSMYN